MTQIYSTTIENLFNEAEIAVSANRNAHTPIIGVSANQKEDTSRVANHYIQAIINAGGIPLIIPQCEKIELLSEIIEHIDGLMLTGGGDISPEIIGEKTIPEICCVDKGRDREEIALVKMAGERQMPMLGICRGHQVINIAYGGKNYRDINAEHPIKPLEHSQKEARNVATHEVKIKEGSMLSQIIGEKTVLTNTFHHQGVSVVAPGFISCAETADGVNEAIEKSGYPVLGVQWHPEPMAAEGDKKMLSIFNWLIDQSAVYKRAREFHRREVSLDSHCDTPMFFEQKINIGKRDKRLKVDIPKLYDGKIDAEIMVAYIPQRGRSDKELREASKRCEELLTELKRQINENADTVVQIYKEDDLRKAKAAAKKGIFLSIENGYAIGKDLSLLKHYKEIGIIYITLCHNGDNDICDSAKGNREHGGLSPFGLKVIQEMNRLGIAVDISHASDESFYGAVKESKSPIIASHSSCRALCKHKRNLTDGQILELAHIGGVIQICIYPDFLSDDGIADVKRVVDHIDHVVETVGIDYVGIGSDFDGGGGVLGCNSANEMINITCELIKRGYGDVDLKKIWGGNFLRVINKIKADSLKYENEE